VFRSGVWRSRRRRQSRKRRRLLRLQHHKRRGYSCARPCSQIGHSVNRWIGTRVGSDIGEPVDGRQSASFCR
jgi:hypothetical protein